MKCDACTAEVELDHSQVPGNSFGETPVCAGLSGEGRGSIQCEVLDATGLEGLEVLQSQKNDFLEGKLQ